MRADRLLSIIMLLETRERSTAQQLAKECEVSERTIYRDIIALSAAGIPIYTESGPGGGVALVDGYHSDLTGLNLDEVRALSMLNIPDPLIKLGVSQELKAALLKLSAALPASSRTAGAWARQRIHLDYGGWFQADEPTPHLQTIYQALREERLIHLVWLSDFEAKIEQIMMPLGLVAKIGNWYLVGVVENRHRTLRVSLLSEANLLDEHFIYPADFDLAVFWKDWCREFEESRSYYPVTARLSPQLLHNLHHFFGTQAKSILAQAEPPDKQGWSKTTLSFDTFETARSRLLSFGRAVEVLQPLALRYSLIDFATQIINFYEGK